MYFRMDILFHGRVLRPAIVRVAVHPAGRTIRTTEFETRSN